MQPSPIRPRSFSRSSVGRRQSQTWKAQSRPAAAARVRSRSASSGPTRRDTRPRPRPPGARPSRSHRSLAWRSVLMAERASAYIGCSGSMARRTPAWRRGRPPPRCRRRSGRGRSPAAGPARPRRPARSAARPAPRPRRSPAGCRQWRPAGRRRPWRERTRRGRAKRPPARRRGESLPTRGDVPPLKPLPPDGHASHARRRVAPRRLFDRPRLGGDVCRHSREKSVSGVADMEAPTEMMQSVLTSGGDNVDVPALAA